MQIKRNVGIALVAVIALFSVYQFGKYVHALANDGPVLTQQKTSDSPSEDPDHDGLTNAEETLWNTDPFNPDSDGDGFKDGEETASGHNPLIPGPDDLISSDNLTEQLSSLTLAGLVAGALDPEKDDYAQSLASITGSVMDSGKYLFNKTVDAESLHVVMGNESVNATYAQAVTPVMKEFSTTLAAQLNNLIDDLNLAGEQGFTESLRARYAKQASVFGAIADTARNMQVPRSFLQTHLSFTSLVQQMNVIDDAVAKGNTDVVKATLALEALGDVPEKYINLLNTFADTLEKEHIDSSSIK